MKLTHWIMAARLIMATIYICNSCHQVVTVIEQESLHMSLLASTQITCWTSDCPNWGKTIDTRDRLNIGELFTMQIIDVQPSSK